MENYGEKLFSQLIEKNDQKFISYNEAITKLSKFSKDPPAKVAMVLKRLKVHEKNGVWLAGAEGELTVDEDGRFLSNLLDATIETNSVEPGYNEWGHLIHDPLRSGWLRNELWFEIEIVHGIMLPVGWDNPMESADPVPSGIVEWRVDGASARPPYLDPAHPRYSPKLAASVHAWMAMDNPSLLRGKSPLQALTTWLELRFKELNLFHKSDGGKHGHKAGEINKTAIEEAAKVANWKPGGGVPPTPK